MKKLLFICVLIMLLFPFAATNRDNFGVAFSGHTLGGAWCECGAPGCICDPGEIPPQQNKAEASPESSDESTPAIDDQTLSTTFMLLLLLVLLRMRL